MDRTPLVLTYLWNTLSIVVANSCFHNQYLHVLPEKVVFLHTHKSSCGNPVFRFSARLFQNGIECTIEPRHCDCVAAERCWVPQVGTHGGASAGAFGGVQTGQGTRAGQTGTAQSNQTGSCARKTGSCRSIGFPFYTDMRLCAVCLWVFRIKWNSTQVSHKVWKIVMTSTREMLGYLKLGCNEDTFIFLLQYLRLFVYFMHIYFLCFAYKRENLLYNNLLVLRETLYSVTCNSD